MDCDRTAIQHQSTTDEKTTLAVRSVIPRITTASLCSAGKTSATPRSSNNAGRVAMHGVAKECIFGVESLPLAPYATAEAALRVISRSANEAR